DVLFHVTVKEDLLARLFALLRPGGWLLISDVIQRAPCTVEEWAQLCDTLWVTGIETQAGYEGLLRQAGFTALSVEDRSADLGAFLRYGRRRIEDGSAAGLGDAAWERAQEDLALLGALCQG